MGLSYSLCQFNSGIIEASSTCKVMSVYSLVLFYTSTNPPFALDSFVINVFLNKSKASNFKTKKSPQCGRHAVINDEGQYQKMGSLQLNT
jgi:hypothetical protein